MAVHDGGFSYWRSVASFLLDFVTAIAILGFGIAAFAGVIGVQDGFVRFHLNGAPAIIFLAVLIGYFVVFNRFLGGTIWRRILGVAPKR